MHEFTLGDLTMLELAMAEFAGKFDISLHASLQMQEIVTKIEFNIQKLSQGANDMRIVPIGDEKTPSPKA